MDKGSFTPEASLKLPCEYIIKHMLLSSNLQLLSNCVRQNEFKGYNSSSASPTDIFEVRLVNGKRLIFKTFISKINSLFITDSNDKKINLQSNNNLLYEQLVYLNKIKPLLVNKICPFFIDLFTLNIDTDIYSMFNFITSVNKTISSKTLELNLKRNLINMLYTQGGWTCYNLLRVDKIDGVKTKLPITTYLDTTKYTYLITHKGRLKLDLPETDITVMEVETEIDTSVESRDILEEENIMEVEIEYYTKDIIQYFVKRDTNDVSIITSEMLKRNETFELLKTIKFGSIVTEQINNTLLNELFYMFENRKENNISNIVLRKFITDILTQSVIACYSLYLSCVSHNDLHPDNIRIVKSKEKNKYLYKINGINYYFESIYCIKVFDYDRSYIKGLNNPNLIDNKHSQTNELVEPKDFIKLFCYIFNKFLRNKQYYENNDSLNEEFLMLAMYYSKYIVKGDFTEGVKVKYNILKTFYSDNGCFLRDNKSIPHTNYDIFYSYDNLIKNFLKLYEITEQDYVDLITKEKIIPYILDRNNFD